MSELDARMTTIAPSAEPPAVHVTRIPVPEMLAKPTLLAWFGSV